MKTTDSFGITSTEALNRLRREGSNLSHLIKLGDISVDIYKPIGEDRQRPHDKDEIYMVISGKGTLNCDKKLTECSTGDILYVPAFREHRFENFSSDFCTWAVFANPAPVESMLV